MQATDQARRIAQLEETLAELRLRPAAGRGAADGEGDPVTTLERQLSKLTEELQARSTTTHDSPHTAHQYFCRPGLGHGPCLWHPKQAASLRHKPSQPLPTFMAACIYVEQVICPGSRGENWLGQGRGIRGKPSQGVVKPSDQGNQHPVWRVAETLHDFSAVKLLV